MADNPDDGKQNLESWFIGGEQAKPIDEQPTLPPEPDLEPDPPPIVPEPEFKASSWARSAVLTAAILAFAGAGAYYFRPSPVRPPEPIPAAPEPKQPSPPIPIPESEPKKGEPLPAPIPITVDKAEPKPPPRPEPRKEIPPPIERVDPPAPKPELIPPPVRREEPSRIVVPDPGPGPQAPVRTRLTRPDVNPIVVPPTPVYTGPSSGIINWSGRIDKDGAVLIDGLPGVPVMIDIDTKEFAIAEAPSPSSGWKRLLIRSRRKVHSVVTIRWTVVQQ